MQEIVHIDCTGKTGTIQGIEGTSLVTLEVARQKGTTETEEYEWHLPCLGGQLFIDGTSVTLWTPRGAKLTPGTFNHKQIVGGFEGKDQVLTITVAVEAFPTRVTADLYNTPGLDAAMREFNTEMNMAMNRATARLKVNLWRIGAALQTQPRNDRKEQPDEGAQSDTGNGLPKGKPSRGPAKSNGSVRR